MKGRKWIIRFLLLACLGTMSACGNEKKQSSDKKQDETTQEKKQDPREHWLDDAEVVGEIDKDTRGWLYDIVQIVDKEDVKGLSERLAGEYADEAIKETLRPRRIAGSINKIYGVEKIEGNQEENQPVTYYILAEGEKDTLGIIVTPGEDEKIAAFQLKIEQDQKENEQKYANQIAQAKSIVNALENGTVEEFVDATKETPITEEIRRATFEEMRNILSQAGNKIESQLNCISREPLDKIETENLDGRAVEITIVDYYDQISMIEHFFLFDEDGKLHDIQYRAYQ